MCANWADNSQKSESLVQALLEPVKNQFAPDGKGGVGLAIAMDTVGEFYNSKCFNFANHETLVFSRSFSSNQL